MDQWNWWKWWHLSWTKSLCRISNHERRHFQGQSEVSTEQNEKSIAKWIWILNFEVRIGQHRQWVLKIWWRFARLWHLPIWKSLESGPSINLVCSVWSRWSRSPGVPPRIGILVEEWIRLRPQSRHGLSSARRCSSDLFVRISNPIGIKLLRLRANQRRESILKLFRANESDRPLGTFYFSHSEALLPFLGLLGLYEDGKQMLHTNFQENSDRAYRTSKIGSFSGNVAFVLYDCDQGI